ncbi:MAG: UPF0182 family protein [Alphaproteobacteria bacterium]|nr:UPF0182 family protein [Alphaproteobacteria bacterium]MDE2111315.1 UPF0182 family protein [Alphaproteobacteria bacterium]MDE2495632.1 UPF0182 family protein [Alphaproteobacteria bacterium]
MIAAIVVAVVGSLLGLGLTASFLVNWSWFSALGYDRVFWTAAIAKAVLFAVVFLLSAGVIWVNAYVAHRQAGTPAAPRLINSPWGTIEGLTQSPVLERLYRHFPWPLLIAVLVFVPALLIALGEMGNWELVLRYLYQVPYGKSDPLFGRDFGFYLFSLPAYIELKSWLLTTLVFGALCAGVLYWVHGAVVFRDRRRLIAPAVIAHGSALLGVFFTVEAWSFWLDRYLLIYGDNGVVVGAGYTDIHVELPILWILAVLSLAAAVASFANLRLRTIRVPVVAALAVFICAMFVSPLLTGVYQRLYVKPNELKFEAPYIARNIALTREAYKLTDILVKPFPANQTLTYQSLQNDSQTIDNIRLWDWQPLLDTYAQLQEIRTYYKFHDVDIDRYELGGKYQQVMLSARELDPSLLPPNAQTWVNQHVLFTHGNGVVMSPVNQTTAEGLPKFYLRDIPPVATGGPAVSQPRIYYGEGTGSYVIAKGSTPEFDYPKGDSNVYATYRGTGGIPIGSLATRALFAYYFGDVNLLLSGYIDNDSRIMFRRNIQQRVQAVVPFLRLDADPYLVISGGRLFWIQDAYTVSSWFPYSKPVEGDTADYMRNSVKAVIDAYNGTVRFYVSDPSDPIIDTYARIFPGVFRPLSAMPPDIRKHIRYPEDFFQAQAQVYRAYHMDTPEVFYNREDLWQFPRQPTSIDGDGDTKMAPYYINMRLPGETQTEFVLMLPMVPSQRENMIAWFAARCDPPNYGKMIVYTFPKDKLIYGPFQVEALINQNTEISQQISLWNQMGSRVIRGHLIVVPVGNSILYVTPLYLRAQTGQMPELKRVIAVYGDRVVMERTLGEALAALFKAPAGAAPLGAAPVAAAAAGPATPVSDTARQALDHYRHAIDNLKAGNWSGFGAELDAMKPLLEQLQQQSQAKPAGAARPH